MAKNVEYHYQGVIQIISLKSYFSEKVIQSLDNGVICEAMRVFSES